MVGRRRRQTPIIDARGLAPDQRRKRDREDRRRRASPRIPGIVAEYKAGKEKAFNSLVGKVMAATKGKANPAQVNAILKRKLAS